MGINAKVSFQRYMARALPFDGVQNTDRNGQHTPGIVNTVRQYDKMASRVKLVARTVAPIYLRYHWRHWRQNGNVMTSTDKRTNQS